MFPALTSAEIVEVLKGCGQFPLRPSIGMAMAKRVLVADDSPLIRKMLCELFEREDDYDVCAEAKNGQEAIDLALKHRPDLIILDWAMPVLGGLAAARELKKIMPEVPIILFTQHAIGDKPVSNLM